jgi:hypothetical protein
MNWSLIYVDFLEVGGYETSISDFVKDEIFGEIHPKIREISKSFRENFACNILAKFRRIKFFVQTQNNRQIFMKIFDENT